MKIVQINATCGSGSTGRICLQISRLLSDNGIENYIIYCTGESDEKNSIKCAGKNYIRLQSLKARLFGNWGFNSQLATKRIIENLEKIKPDIVHLHNIHGHDCNLGMLFDYLKNRKIRVVWTFHDCWAFTGYCTHFILSGCEKWKNGCKDCPQKKSYSLIADRSRELYNRKKSLVAGADITVVTPSEWLANLVKKSFFKDHPIRVINNGIDTDIFKPTESGFREKYGVGNKKIVLGVAFDWSFSKGLDVFAELSKRLGKEYQVVLVGTDSSIDSRLPDNILSIHRTSSQNELAEIYSAADVFVNPTREDSYPTVNMEAIACGTPVVTFRTGGSPETVGVNCGAVVDVDNVDALQGQINHICENNPFTFENIAKIGKCFNREERFKEYLELYKEIYD